MPLGAARADHWLGGGLRRDGLHEAYAAGPADMASAAAFALLLAHMRGREDGRALIWVRHVRGTALPFGAGLAELGLDPDAITLMLAPDGKAALRAGLDAARDGSVACVLVELEGNQPLLDLTASRRFALAAAEMRTMVLLLRLSARPGPSAAHTRWQVSAAPSRPLEANAPGMPAFSVDLLRQRGGRDGLSLVVEWDREAGRFREGGDAGAAPLPRPLPAVDSGGARDTRRNRAA